MLGLDDHVAAWSRGGSLLVALGVAALLIVDDQHDLVLQRREVRHKLLDHGVGPKAGDGLTRSTQPCSPTALTSSSMIDREKRF